MSKSKKLPVPNFAGITHGKPHASDFGGGLARTSVESPAQCEPTEASPTRMQHQWAAAPDLGSIPKGYDK